jgi:alpha-tubulin suppressor-like RCC1 family protein
LAWIVVGFWGSDVRAAASTSGQVYAFGNNRFGQLGITTNNDSDNANPTLQTTVLPGATGPVVRAAAGDVFSLAVTSTGELYGFGDNRYGQLGTSTNNGVDLANPTPTLVGLPGATGPVVWVAARNAHSLAITSSGQLYAFGYNYFGQLGTATNNATFNANPTPTQVVLPGATGPVTQAAAGGDYSLAVTSSGQLYAFGYNYFGQLGTSFNSATQNASPTPMPVGLPGATGAVIRVAAGNEHSLAITSSGQLYAFGRNRYGQLGTTTNNGSDNADPNPAQVTLPGATGPVVQADAGDDDTLVVTSSGQLYAFGYNRYGELGTATNNNTDNANPTPAPVVLPGATGRVVQVVAGGTHSLAVTSSGQLYAFGKNASGELGTTANNATTNPNPTPVEVPLPTGTTIGSAAIGSGAAHTLAIVSNLAVATGSLPDGQVGVAYDTTAQASGGMAPYHWSASGLPTGLSIGAETGAISGTPTAAGDATTTVTVTDDDHIASSRELALTIFSPPPISSASPIASPPLTTLTIITVTLAWEYSVSRSYTTLSRLTVKGVPHGSTITVTCRKKCPRRKLVKHNVAGSVSLRPFLNKPLKPKTVIMVVVAKPNAIAAVKILKMRARKSPVATTRCMPPGAKIAQRC